MEGQLPDKSSDWFIFQRDKELTSIQAFCFSEPMTIVIEDDPDDCAKALIDKVFQHFGNIIFDHDPASSSCFQHGWLPGAGGQGSGQEEIKVAGM